jgi:hypothetical protein
MIAWKRLGLVYSRECQDKLPEHELEEGEVWQRPRSHLALFLPRDLLHRRLERRTQTRDPIYAQCGRRHDGELVHELMVGQELLEVVGPEWGEDVGIGGVVRR